MQPAPGAKQTERKACTDANTINIQPAATHRGNVEIDTCGLFAIERIAMCRLRFWDVDLYLQRKVCATAAMAKRQADACGLCGKRWLGVQRHNNQLLQIAVALVHGDQRRAG